MTDVFKQFIQSSTIGNLIDKVKPIEQQRDLIDLPATATIEEALDLLLAEDIKSVPIYELDQNEKKYIMIVSALDLLRLICSQITEDINSQIEVKEELLLIPLKEAIHFSEHLTILKSSELIDKLIGLFTIEHRALVDYDSKLVLLSQMDLIQYLQLENHKIGSNVLDLTVESIKYNEIKSMISYKTTAVEAFLKLGADSRVTSLPIIDDTEEFIAELSSNDLRGLNRERLSALRKPVIMYLKESHGSLPAPMTCHFNFTLSQLLSAFILRNTNKLWCLDPNTGQLKAVITLTDIITTLASV
ncbi:hypothetical protein CU097_006255 [Rhizopus azygosporus]|uniref:CBS domain-containing protein n=1 Tax=Rhizopus azygosporus TaxID=86630 RepID=A0A367J753_RHIAZ|nr:hypothetical protein CU097_006255 [Rhizopus azygosporus]